MCNCKQGTCPGGCPCGCSHTPAYQWQPGDVAIGYNDHWEIRVVRQHGGSTGDYWSAASGEWPIGVSSDDLSYRPLIVLDPENEDDVARAHRSINRAWEDAEAFQSALRGLAMPVPPEPAVGGVVLDRDGATWVRFKSAGIRPWRPDYPGDVTPAAGRCVFWTEIPQPITVLSPGYVPGGES